MISVLFVDDEPHLRADLQRMLRRRRDRWSMRFAGSGAEALDLLRTESADVVVSDMQMPGMNGAELLAKIRRDHPDAILIILSGQCDRRTALRTVDPAHLYLAKPCDVAVMVDTIERAYRLRTLLSAPPPHRSGATSRASMQESPVYAELAGVLRDPDVSAAAVAELIGRDATLTTKILQLVNTAFFGASGRVRDPAQAIKLLGLDLMRSLVLDMARVDAWPPASAAAGQSPDFSVMPEQSGEIGIAVTAAEAPFAVRFANETYCRAAEAPMDRVVGAACRVLVGPEADPLVVKTARDGRDVRTTLRQSRRDGCAGWSDLSVTPLLDGTGKLAYFLCTQTELGAADTTTDGTDVRPPAIAFDGLDEGILLLDRAGRVVAVNGALEAICNYSPSEVVGRTLDFLRSPLHSPEFYEDRRRAVEATGYWRGESWHRLRNGLSVPHLLAISVVHDRDARVRYQVVTLRTALKKRDLERLRFLSNRDPLTGLPNRASFGEDVAAAIERARLSKSGVGVMAIRLDRFKLVADSLGARAADELLCGAAARLRDHVGERGLVGGSARGEFLLVLEDWRDADQDIVAKDLSTDLCRPLALEGHEVSVNVAIGLSCFPEDGDDAADLIAHAQAALAAPEDGAGGSFQRFEPGMSARSIARFTIGNDLRTAIDRGELRLHYQPKVSSATGRVTGLEALVRWHHPQDGLVSPARFIPVAEETRLIDAIGDWTLEEACTQMRAWQVVGIAPARMAVNLSPHQFRQADLLGRIRSVLARTRLDPCFFEAEITESSTMADPEAAIRLMNALNDMGVKLSIDDFGTGYSSLTYLKRFPVSAIKIDQSFVRGLPHDANDVAITEAIIALGKSLRLGLVAEGVETPDQRAFLVARACDEMQGFLFGKPEDAAATERFLRANAGARRTDLPPTQEGDQVRRAAMIA